MKLSERSKLGPTTAMLPLPLALSLSLTSPWQHRHCSLSAPRRSAGTAADARSCGVAAAIMMCAAVVTMRSVFPGAAALARAWNLRNAESFIRRGLSDPQTGRARSGSLGTHLAALVVSDFLKGSDPAVLSNGSKLPFSVPQPHRRAK